MAQTGNLTDAPRAPPLLSPVTGLRIAIIVAAIVLWEIAAYIAGILGQIDPSLASLGTIMSKVMPSLVVIGHSLAQLLFYPDLKWSLSLGGSAYELPQVAAPGRSGNAGTSVSPSSATILATASHAVTAPSRPLFQLPSFESIK